MIYRPGLSRLTGGSIVTYRIYIYVGQSNLTRGYGYSDKFGLSHLIGVSDYSEYNLGLLTSESDYSEYNLS